MTKHYVFEHWKQIGFSTRKDPGSNQSSLKIQKHDLELMSHELSRNSCSFTPNPVKTDDEDAPSHSKNNNTRQNSHATCCDDTKCARHFRFSHISKEMSDDRRKITSNNSTQRVLQDRVSPLSARVPLHLTTTREKLDLVCLKGNLGDHGAHVHLSTPASAHLFTPASSENKQISNRRDGLGGNCNVDRACERKHHEFLAWNVERARTAPGREPQHHGFPPDAWPFG